MSRWSLAVLAAALAGPPALLAAAAQAPDPALEEGVRQAQEGDFELAVVTLDGVVQKLRGKGSSGELTRAHVYLGVAYLGLRQEQPARASFLEALRMDPGLQLSRREYPPRIVDFFEEVRRSGAAAPPAAPAVRRAEAAAPAKKGGSKTPLVLVALGGAAAAGVAVAAGGGGGGDSGGGSGTTPVVAPVAASGISLTEIAPPSGSSITIPQEPPYYGSLIPRQSGLLRVGVSVTSGADLAQASLGIQLHAGGAICGFNLPDLPSWTLQAGQSVTYTVTGFQLFCPRPFQITAIRAFLRGPGLIQFDPPPSDILMEATFPASYTIRN